jgi:hypothetical protein
VNENEVMLRGTIGTATSWLAVVASLLPNIEQWLRISSLLVGLSVGIVTLIQLVRRGSGK